MITVITEEVLEAAREMNRRDILRAEHKHNIENDSAEPFDVDDDEIWAKYKSIQGLKGAEGQPLKVGGSHYSYGPYPRNRRILADVALAAGWSVEKARILERRCVNRNAKHMSSPPNVMVDLSDPNQPKMKNGRPLTFQNVSWSFLRNYIELEMKEMDPTKLSIVKAAVLDLYETNSKTGKKNIPVYPPGTKRRSDDTIPVSDDDIKRAQEELDKRERYIKASRMQFLDRKSYVPPDKVKARIKAFLQSSNMSEEEFQKAIDVTESEFEMFMKEKKKQPLLESKVFHNAPPFISEQKGEQPARKRKRSIEILDDA
ncbi:uncharacterized protein GGS22DRAFT_191723 [Annulohypoxylon maeteangense]|uniref:uncharacterized protein n=1 Tax=Annulohypoxylon maeteangense TaxID=1927788 RepID=UPI002008040A|nr:uncharacterized protein GGS22DRAFT_191723 [Annulohypoxylon maeteangense]KAI0881994.1 hypothetical protein GGS22DRAFT_191723 [Annulohypoxylon maeteangense]